MTAAPMNLNAAELLPTLGSMNRLLEFVEFIGDQFGDLCQEYELFERGLDHSAHSLLTDLCLARFYRDPVGKAAARQEIVPDGMWPGDVVASLWNNFIELFPSLEIEEARRVARLLVYGSQEAPA